MAEDGAEVPRELTGKSRAGGLPRVCALASATLPPRPGSRSLAPRVGLRLGGFRGRREVCSSLTAWKAWSGEAGAGGMGRRESGARRLPR